MIRASVDCSLIERGFAEDLVGAMYSYVSHQGLLCECPWEKLRLDWRWSGPDHTKRERGEQIDFAMLNNI